MAEFQFERTTAKSEAAELVAEADTKDRDSAEKLADIFNRVVDRFGIAGTVREEDSIWFERENILGGGFCWNYRNVAAVIHKEAQDILFDPIIVGDDSVVMCG